MPVLVDAIWSEYASEASLLARVIAAEAAQAGALLRAATSEAARLEAEEGRTEALSRASAAEAGRTTALLRLEASEAGRMEAERAAVAARAAQEDATRREKAAAAAEMDAERAKATALQVRRTISREEASHLIPLAMSYVAKVSPLLTDVQAELEDLRQLLAQLHTPAGKASVGGPAPHAHSPSCNHAPATEGTVLAAAKNGDPAAVQTALEAGGSTEEADKVRV